jgi:hypothetical protein
MLDDDLEHAGQEQGRRGGNLFLMVLYIKDLGDGDHLSGEWLQDQHLLLDTDPLLSR